MSKKALGKGLSALIRDEEVLVPSDQIQEVKIEEIKPNKDQPRKSFNKKALEELANSIKEHGILQPLIIIKEDQQYFLVAGERRLRAALLAGLKTVPVIEKQMLQLESSQMAIIENIQREDLNPIEEGAAYQKLIETYNFTQETLATKLGKSRTYIANILRLEALPQKIKDYIVEGRLSGSHGRSILSVPKDQQLALAEYILDKKLTVREVEALTKDYSPEKLLGITRKKVTPNKDIHILEVEKRLETIYGTKALVQGSKKGKIVLEYYSEEDLIRLIDLLQK